MARERLFTWDWKEQPPMTEIAAFVAELSGGSVVMREHPTGSDQYALVIADHQISEADAGRVYESWAEGGHA